MACRFLVLCALGLLARGYATPLDDYVKKPDPSYKYEVFNSVRGPSYTLYMVNMTSQTWKPDLQSQPVWWHYLYITVPDKIDINNTGFLFIDGGSNTNAPPPPTDTFVELTTIVAATTNTIGACLKQIPNQPIVFKADPIQKRRTEDAIIAWTWKTFVDQAAADPEILLRMPMTKAGVRALDTISDLTQKKAGYSVDRFLVAGASKRGWTTWTVGAVDSRVVAMAPIVMDLMHIQTNLHHYFRSLGGWTFAFDDYYALNFTQDLDSPYIKAMADIIDPISYNDRFVNKPKYITSTGGDEFFMIDDAKYFYNEIQGPTYLRMVPNAEHSLAGHETSLLLGIRAFYLSVMLDIPLPKLDWKLNTKTMQCGDIMSVEQMASIFRKTSTGGTITLNTNVPPEVITCYYATTLDGKRKDFRLLRGTPGNPSKPQVHPVLWLKQAVKPLSETTFVAEMQNPRVGWTAFFIQVTFAGHADSVLEFTTQTLVIPDTYPFPDCQGNQCRGTLV